MVLRLLQNDHEVVVWDRSEETIEKIQKEGAIGASSLEYLVEKLASRKARWMMVPEGKPVDEIFALESGVHYIICGTSGGVWGLKNGYCLIYGGESGGAAFMEPIFKTLAPKNGYVNYGESGTGQMVKMVYNGIEYGMMQAYAEIFEILEKSSHDIDLKAVADAWQYGSVIRSWLLELAVLALEADPKLDDLEGYVSDSGEGRWTVQTAMDFVVPVHVNTAALYTRSQSRQEESFAMKMLSALRNQFGDHAVKSKS